MICFALLCFSPGMSLGNSPLLSSDTEAVGFNIHHSLLSGFFPKCLPMAPEKVCFMCQHVLTFRKVSG